jgi:hypothetical protein
VVCVITGRMTRRFKQPRLPHAVVDSNLWRPKTIV